MQVTVRNSTAVLEIADSVLSAPFNETLVHQLVTAYMAGGRAGTKKQKTRSEVRGGGAKPFKQKGSGRARAGTIRSPLWRTGGKVFAARPRDFSQKVNRKMYRVGLCSIFSELNRQGRLVVLENIALENGKTKSFLAWAKAQDFTQKVLLISDEVDENLYLATRNLHAVQVTDVAGIDPVSLVGFETVVITAAALSAVGEWLA